MFHGAGASTWSFKFELKERLLWKVVVNKPRLRARQA